MWKMIVMPVIFLRMLSNSNGQNLPAMTMLTREQKTEIMRLNETLQFNYVYPDTARSMISHAIKVEHLPGGKLINRIRSCYSN